MRAPSAPALLILLGLSALLVLPGFADAEDTGREALARLKRALKRGDLDERREAVNDVGRLSGHLDRAQSVVAAKTLRGALESEESGEVRRLMIRALARFKLTHAWIPVILTSQSDRDPAVRDQARREVLSGGADYLEVMEKILKEETSAAFRAELLLILRDRRRPDAAPLLIRYLEDRSRIVRAAAAEALEAVSGEALGYDAKRWKVWHARWLVARPEDGGGPSVSPEVRVEEPPPHVTRSLHPKFYDLGLTSKDIVFVIDISGSVGAAGFGRAKRQLTDAVALLGSDVRIAALFFSDEVHMWKDGRMVPASPANKEDLIKFLRGLKAGRKTDVYTPLNAGLRIVGKRIEAKLAAEEVFREPVTMITVSDGKDNVAAVPPRVVADKLDRLDPRYAVLHSVVVGEKDSPLMHAIARLGGGHYLRVENR
jgi:HEAT repeat protein